MRTSPLPWPRPRRVSNSRWTRYRGLSARSTRSSRRGPSAKICRASSEPIDPPPPVITTVRSWNSSSTPAARSVTIGRRRRSSSWTLRARYASTLPSSNSASDGTVRTSRFIASAASTTRRTRGTGGAGHRDEQGSSARRTGGSLQGLEAPKHREVTDDLSGQPGSSSRKPTGRNPRRAPAVPSGRRRRPLDRLQTAG